MKIIFQNSDFVALDKPSGWLTTPARFGEKDPRPVLGLELQKKLGQQIFPVHRLDFEVSGLVLFALNASAHSQANQQFENKKVQKTYQARTEKQNPISPAIGDSFEWKARVLRGKKRAYESPHGKPSLTLAKVVGHDDEIFFWELRPVTGRSHQLRFDLARHGFPIVGDELYGAEILNSKDQIDLRSIEIDFLDEGFVERWKLPKKLQAEPLFQLKD